MEPVCSGWLTKSPSSKYVTLFSRGKFHIQIPLRSKWRRRYFLLYKPQGSLPHQYRFDYFKDTQCQRRRGSINLEECTEILSALDSSHYQHLFSLKTTTGRKARVYYLAADSDDDMTRWVTCLSRLCQLTVNPAKAQTSAGHGAKHTVNDSSPQETSYVNHCFPPNPPERLDSMQLMVDIPSRTSNQNLADEQLSNEILEEIRAIELGQSKNAESATSSHPLESYTDLADCSTGAAVVEAIDHDSFIQTYDVPRSSLQKTTASSPRVVSKSVKVFGGASNLSSEIAAKSSTLPTTRIMINQEADAPPRPPKFHKRDEIYQNVPSNSPQPSRSASSTSPPTRSISPSSQANKHLSESISPPIRSHSPHSHLNKSDSTTAEWHENLTMRKDSLPGYKSEDEQLPNTNHSSKAKKYSVDSVYHNTATSQEQHRTDSNISLDNISGNNVRVEQLYDIPKSFSVPPPPMCPGPLGSTATVHKYVNAAAKAMPANSGIVIDRTDVESQHAVSNGSLRRASVGDLPPSRPPKPRNLSDPTTLDTDNVEVFNSDLESGEPNKNHSQSSSVLRVSKSFRTKSYTKDNVFSDEDDTRFGYEHSGIASPPYKSLPEVREDIKLPLRTNLSTSSSSMSSSDEEDGSADMSHRDRQVTFNSETHDSLYQVPPSNPKKVKLPPKLNSNQNTIQPAFLSSRNLTAPSAVSSINSADVRRSSSLSKVPPPSYSSAHKFPKPVGSPRFLHESSGVREERSSSMSISERKLGKNMPSPILTRIVPVPHVTLTSTVSDIQYVELEQSMSESPSPGLSRSARSSFSTQIPSNGTKPQATELEYTDIDLLKTKALSETIKERDLKFQKENDT